MNLNDDEIARHEPLLNFITEKFQSVAILDQALRQLGFDFQGQGIFADKASLKDNVVELMTRAGKTGCIVPLAFCVLAEKYEDKASTLAAKVLPPTLRWGIQLHQILRGDTIISLEKVDRCRREVCPKNLVCPGIPPSEVAGKMFSFYSLVVAQDCPDGKEAFIEFSFRIFQYLDQAPRQKLMRWWDGAKAELKLNGELPGLNVERLPQVNERYSVLIKLKEGPGCTLKKPCWIPEAWVYGHETGLMGELFARKNTASLNPREKPVKSIETLKTIPAYLSGLRDQLETRWGIAPDSARFEFFVSRFSVNHAMDQWPIPIDRFVDKQLGFKNPVIVRDLDRLVATRASVRQRWDRLLETKFLCECGNLVCDKAIELEPNAACDLELLGNLVCLILTSPFPRQPRKPEEVAALSAAVAAGVPVVLWVRNEAAKKHFKAEVREWLRSSPLDLPETLQKFRRDVPRDNLDHLGRHVTLFFEDARHWLPDNEATWGNG